MTDTAVDLFGGWGWAEGLHGLIEETGIDLDPDVCATRIAVGHATIEADVTTVDPKQWSGTDGVIASPPCQDWTVNGPSLKRLTARGRLVDVVPSWVDVIRPRWILCEQVPPALSAWNEHADLYRTWGYDCWTGVLNAAHYGIGQNRRRAYLIASLDRPATPPPPTHGPGLLPLVTLGETVGRKGFWMLRHNSAHRDRPRGVDGKLLTYDGHGNDFYIRYPADEPSPTLTSMCYWWRWEGRGFVDRNLSLAEALAIQGVRGNMPIVGNKKSVYTQIANSVIPHMARVLAERVTR